MSFFGYSLLFARKHMIVFTSLAYYVDHDVLHPLPNKEGLATNKRPRICHTLLVQTRIDVWQNGHVTELSSLTTISTAIGIRSTC
ncbi:predicted protein [Lichtheimia corymbifera JMRC:FSU:9682]|uniref:Uncharacterized protein n=1 Tax=Lichtheimia corymbifera JMRC:FSU:9682 TaxID=1263082 RepID=A0A068S0R9_9FUNG|nr:predicted protein [Lichtheimia corymbifera JMRC:FSU:9682]